MAGMLEASFVIGAIFFVVFYQGVTNKQLRKMKQLEKICIEYEESGLNVKEFCKKIGIQRSKFYYWWPRYKKQKEAGLIDRRKGVAHKITSEVREYIREVKKNDRLKSGPDIAQMIKRKFGMEISDFHVQRVLKELGMNDPVGRKTGKSFKKTSN